MKKDNPYFFRCFKFKTNLFAIGLILIFSITSCGSHSPLFKSSSKKGPNIYSSKPPRTKSRSKLYAHSISKKKTKVKGATFSSKKGRYKSSTNGGKSKNKAAKSSSGGRKSGKGRKK